ncbi:MAG: hypothetical protein WCP20_12895 [Desulfuromonadales bacterium]
MDSIAFKTGLLMAGFLRYIGANSIAPDHYSSTIDLGYVVIVLGGLIILGGLGGSALNRKS